MNAITGLVRRWGHEDAEVGKDPVGNILYPVIDTYNGEPHTVGVLQMYLYWRGLFLNILSTGVLDAVFFSTCSDAFTYRIDGPNVHYLSPGDAHDPKYSNLEQSIFVVDGFNNKLTEGTQYAGAVLSDKLWYVPFTNPSSYLS